MTDLLIVKSQMLYKYKGNKSLLFIAHIGLLNIYFEHQYG